MIKQNLNKKVRIGDIIELIKNEIFEWEVNEKGKPKPEDIIELLKDYSTERK